MRKKDLFLASAREYLEKHGKATTRDIVEYHNSMHKPKWHVGVHEGAQYLKHTEWIVTEKKSERVTYKLKEAEE